MPLDPELLEILACPQCKEPVEADPGQEFLLCRRCRLKYPVKDDIPIMLVDEALHLDD